MCDITHQYKAVLLASILIPSALNFLLVESSSFLIVVSILFAVRFFDSPSIPVVDSCCLKILGEQKKEYGKLRLWGAVGWGITSPIVGFFAVKYGYQAHLISQLVLRIIAAGFVCVMKFTSNDNLINSPDDGSDTNKKDHNLPFKRKIMLLFKSTESILFFLIYWLMGITMGVIGSFLFLWIEQLGGNNSLMGLSLTMMCVAEIPLFYISG